MKNFFKFNIKLILAFFAVALLASCEKPGDEFAGGHTINITYAAGGDPNHPDTGPFIFDKYEIVIPHGSSRVPIKLVIKSAGYSFPDDLRVAFNVTPDDGNILVRSLGARDKTLMLRDLNLVTQTYKYGVVIVDDATGQEYIIDPRIQNGGGGTNSKKNRN